MQALILIGSPKANKSNSFSIAEYLSIKLQRKEVRCHFQNILANYTKISDIVRFIGNVDIVVLVTPLYSCALPGHVTYFMERIYMELEQSSKREIATFMIVNSAFSEHYQSDIASEIFKNWSDMCDFNYHGTVAIGMGQALKGISLHKRLFTLRLRRNLTLLANDISKGESISSFIFDRFKDPLLPVWFYKRIAELQVKHKFKKYNTKPFIKPYMRKNIND